MRAPRPLRTPRRATSSATPLLALTPVPAASVAATQYEDPTTGGHWAARVKCCREQVLGPELTASDPTENQSFSMFLISALASAGPRRPAARRGGARAGGGADI